MVFLITKIKLLGNYWIWRFSSYVKTAQSVQHNRTFETGIKKI